MTNLETVARLARDRGIECIVQIVFLTENARELPETIADFAGRGVTSFAVIPLIDVNGRSRRLDPRHELPPGDVDAVRQRCREAAREHGVRLIWHVDDVELVDHRSEPAPTEPRKRAQEIWQLKLQLYRRDTVPSSRTAFASTSEGMSHLVATT